MFQRLAPAAWEPWRLSLFLGAYFAAAGVFLPYFPLYLEYRGLTAAQIGVVMAAAQTTRIIGPNFWGWLADHTPHRLRIMQLTAVATCVLFALLIAPGGFWWILPIFFATQFCGTGQMPVSEAIIAARLRGDAHAAARYGRLRAWGSIGFVAMVLATGPVFDRFGIAVQPWLVVMLLALTAAATYLVRDAPHADLVQQRVSVRARLAEPRVRWFFASVVLMIFAHGVLYSFLSLHLQQLGYSKAAIGVLWVSGVVVEIAFFYTQGRFFKRFGVYPLLTATFILAAIRFALIAQFADVVVLLVVAQVLHAATFAVHHSASILTIQRWFSGAAAARGQALYISLGYGVGGTAGSLSAAWLWSAIGPAAAFWSSSVAAILGWWAVRRSERLDSLAMRLPQTA
jgi:PPP family 3-phenylpropionic acid transporter